MITISREPKLLIRTKNDSNRKEIKTINPIVIWQWGFGLSTMFISIYFRCYIFLDFWWNLGIMWGIKIKNYVLQFKKIIMETKELIAVFMMTGVIALGVAVPLYKYAFKKMFILGALAFVGLILC